MPKVLELRYGISVYIYFKDHNPPHLHVYKGDAGSHEASIILEIGSWEVLKVSGFSERDGEEGGFGTKETRTRSHGEME